MSSSTTTVGGGTFARSSSMATKRKSKSSSWFDAVRSASCSRWLLFFFVLDFFGFLVEGDTFLPALPAEALGKAPGCGARGRERSLLKLPLSSWVETVPESPSVLLFGIFRRGGAPDLERFDANGLADCVGQGSPAPTSCASSGDVHAEARRNDLSAGAESCRNSTLRSWESVDSVDLSACLARDDGLFVRRFRRAVPCEESSDCHQYLLCSLMVVCFTNSSSSTAFMSSVLPSFDPNKLVPTRDSPGVPMMNWRGVRTTTMQHPSKKMMIIPAEVTRTGVGIWNSSLGDGGMGISEPARGSTTKSPGSTTGLGESDGCGGTSRATRTATDSDATPMGSWHSTVLFHRVGSAGKIVWLHAASSGEMTHSYWKLDPLSGKGGTTMRTTAAPGRARGDPSQKNS
mmetsp:Transcript_98322/g.225746  ORF Transcript_98322/g.225746 Transcript_98322/m.225746 type:complete len:402 (+) Transcript_98322:352-1557(+)